MNFTSLTDLKKSEIFFNKNVGKNNHPGITPNEKV